VCPAGHGRRADAPKLDLAQVFRQHGHHLPELSPHQARTVNAITSCRTAALGGHVYECDTCGFSRHMYNSCRNRHCPQCQGLDATRWVERQQEALLPIEYHHVVFTLPDVLQPLLRRNPRAGYGLLFAAAAETLQEVARRPRNLGARIGFTAVLHTWTQTLAFHPHVHCVVTGGGLSTDGRWVAAKPRFLFAIKVLMRVFRGKLLSKLEKALDDGTLQADDPDPKGALRRAARKDWNVYSKPPFAGPDQVLRYIGRYTHRIAISNARLVSMDHSQIAFRWRDRADGDRSKLMALDAAEFLRRFLMHLLPPGFMRIRHYGLLANAGRKQSIEVCKALLGVGLVAGCNSTSARETWQELVLRLTGKDVTRCPRCRQGTLVIVAKIEPLRPSRPRPPPRECAA
jgi:hypothetical protein